MRVLVVEDEPYMADAIRDGLRLEAIAADVAGDGDSALELLSINSYDLAVLDRDIPPPSGDEIARRVAASGRRRPTPPPPAPPPRAPRPPPPPAVLCRERSPDRRFGQRHSHPDAHRRRPDRRQGLRI